tara:strand:- start:4715 stop:5386 length:672 start_codon:yes stop_codon:yes gene_type:complete
MAYFENIQESEEAISSGPVPASYSKRIGAVIVDILIGVLAAAPATILFLIGLVGGIKDADEVDDYLTDDQTAEVFWEAAAGFWIIAAVLGVATFVWAIWYFGYRQGKIGLTPGKRVAGIKLINIETGTPPGGAKGLGRSIIPSLLGSFSSGIYQLIDYLWPLWDDKNQRITDKMFSTQVVLDQNRKAQQGVSNGSQGISSGIGGSDPLANFDQGSSGDTPIIS